MKKLAGPMIVVMFMIAAFAEVPVGEISNVKESVRFAPVDIYVNSGKVELAAYQFKLKAVAGSVKIVGVEGGEHEAFKEAPYYDTAALANDRIIIAGFNTGSNLPKGQTRIARIHLQITGEVVPEYELKLIVAADTQGREIAAEINLGTKEN